MFAKFVSFLHQAATFILTVLARTLWQESLCPLIQCWDHHKDFTFLLVTLFALYFPSFLVFIFGRAEMESMVPVWKRDWGLQFTRSKHKQAGREKDHLLTWAQTPRFLGEPGAVLPEMGFENGFRLHILVVSYTTPFPGQLWSPRHRTPRGGNGCNEFYQLS